LQTYFSKTQASVVPKTPARLISFFTSYFLAPRWLEFAIMLAL
jgi:hypothetical protein